MIVQIILTALVVLAAVIIVGGVFWMAIRDKDEIMGFIGFGAFVWIGYMAAYVIGVIWGAVPNG